MMLWRRLTLLVLLILLDNFPYKTKSDNIKFYPAWNLFGSGNNLLPPSAKEPNCTLIATDRVRKVGDFYLKNVEEDNPANSLVNFIEKSQPKEAMPHSLMNVRLDLLLIKVKTTIEKEGIFESVVALYTQWHDLRHVWQPEDFGNTTALNFKADVIWIPDIALINSADNQYSITKDPQFNVRLSHDGTVTYVPTGTARTWCPLKLLTFPFDFQTCNFEFESWTMDTTKLLFNSSSRVIVDESFESGQWTLCAQTAWTDEHIYNISGQVDVFSRLRFNISVRRKSTFYVVNLIFPCATISFIQVLTFTIPSKDAMSNRVGFGMTNVLTLVVFQTIITGEMPRTSDAITTLSDYVIALILTSAAGILQSVYVERMLRMNSKPPPKIAVKLLRLVPMLWNPPNVDGFDELTNGISENKEEENNKNVKKSSKKQQTTKQRREKSSIPEWMPDDDVQSPISALVKRRHIGKILGQSPSSVANNNKKLMVNLTEKSFATTAVPTTTAKSTSFSSYDERKQKKVEEKRLNSRLWGELLTRFDSLIFVICLVMVFGVPIFLFLPHVVTDISDCSNRNFERI